jgi:ribosomal protein L32E
MLSKEKYTQIIEALKTNPNARAVARQVGGVSNVTVWKIARQVGIDLLKPKLSEEKRTQIIAAFKANPNASAVARQLGGVSRQTIRKIARQAGIRLAAATGERPELMLEHRPEGCIENCDNPCLVAAPRGKVGWLATVAVAEKIHILKFVIGHGVDEKGGDSKISAAAKGAFANHKFRIPAKALPLLVGQAVKNRNHVAVRIEIAFERPFLPMREHGEKRFATMRACDRRAVRVDGAGFDHGRFSILCLLRPIGI